MLNKDDNYTIAIKLHDEFQVEPHNEPKHESLVKSDCKMNKTTHRTRRAIKERGWALLVIVTMLAVLLNISTFEIILTNVSNLKETRIYLAIDDAEETAIAATSPIKKEITEMAKKQLEDTLNSRLTARTTFCQTAVNPTGSLSEQPALCDPVHLLDNLNVSKTTSIDFFSKYQINNPLSYKDNPDYDWQKKYLDYVSYNKIDYKLTPIYVGEDLLYTASPYNRTTREFPKPRMEEYRYMIQADIQAETYEKVNYQLRANFDVAINVVAFDDSTPTSPCNGSTISLPGYTYVKGVVLCGPPDSNGIAQCGFAPVGSDRYNQTCRNGAQQTDTCIGDIRRTLNNCPADSYCSVNSSNGGLNGGIAVGIPGKPSGVTTGCTSTTTGSGINAKSQTYTWSVSVKLVGLGHNFY